MGYNAIILNIFQTVKNVQIDILIGDTLLRKQCLCSHKDSKQLSGGHAGKLFLLVGGTAPKPLFAEFHSVATHRSGAFSPAPGGDF
ncbi:hypothetical protein AALD01_18755 [Oscillospiraceae bacterium 21-37]